MIPQIQRRVLRLGRAPRFQQLLAALDPLIWLSLDEASGSIARNHAFTTYSPDNPGPDLLSNGDFSAWTGSAPNDSPSTWTASESPPNAYVTENPAGECQFISDGSFVALTQTIFDQGDSYRSQAEISNVVSGDLVWGSAFSEAAMGGSTGLKTRDFVVPLGTSAFRIRRSAAANLTVDDVSIRKIGEIDAALAGGISLDQVGLLGGTHAVALDGSTGLGTIYNRASIQGLTAFTLSQLIRPDTLTNGDYLWFKADEIEVWLNADGSLFARAHYDTTDAETSSAAGVLSAGAWAFVHVVLDDSDDTLYLYVNDTLVNDTVQAGVDSRVANGSNLLLWKNASSNGFDGLVDELALRDRVSSVAELAPLAQALGLA